VCFRVHYRFFSSHFLLHYFLFFCGFSGFRGHYSFYVLRLTSYVLRLTFHVLLSTSYFLSLRGFMWVDIGISSIQFIFILVILRKRTILLFFPENRIPADQPVDLGPHKAPEGILRGADDRFTTHIE